MGRAIEAVPEVAVGQVGPAPGAALEEVGSGLLYSPQVQGTLARSALALPCSRCPRQSQGT